MYVHYAHAQLRTDFSDVTRLFDVVPEVELVEHDDTIRVHQRTVVRLAQVELLAAGRVDVTRGSVGTKKHARDIQQLLDST